MCSHPETTKNFVVVALNGIHHLNVDFCKCPGAPERYDQLLEVGWWLATPLNPCTAATFAVLRHFHVVNLRSCTAATDYYCSLEILTNGHGLDDIPVSPSPL